MDRFVKEEFMSLGFRMAQDIAEVLYYVGIYPENNLSLYNLGDAILKYTATFEDTQ